MSLKKWFIFSVVLKALDIAMSLYLVFRSGTSVESNRFVSNMMEAYGVIPGLALNGFIVFALLCVLREYDQKRLLIVASAMLSVVAAINLITIIIG